MRRFLLILLCVAALASAKTPRPLANLTLAAPPGMKPTKLTDYAGKVMVIAVFSTECEPCTTAILYLERLQKEFKDKGVQMVGAAANGGAISTIRPFMDRYKITIPLGVLTEAEARRLTDSGPADRLMVPAFIFVDKKGQVRVQYPGNDKFFDDGDKNTRAVIESLLRQ
jgi:peroxiredoxin